MAPPDRKKLAADLQKALAKNNLAKAVESYRALIEADPEDFKLHNALGDTLVRLNKKDEAVSEFKTAAAKFAADGFIAQAMAIYQKSLKLKEDPDIRLGMADIQSRQGLAAEAKKNYLQVAEKYMQDKAVRKAVDVMQRIADLDPGNVDLRIKIARICEQEGLASKAVEEYRKAGRALLERKETAKAASCFQKVIDALPADVDSKFDYQKAIYLSGKFREARDGFGALRKLDPKNTDFLLWEGKAAYRLEDFAGAEEIFRKILEVAPDKVETHKYLIRVYRKTKQADKASETVRLLVDQLVTEKKYEPAVTLIRETLEDFPGHCRMLATLVTVAKLAGDRSVQRASLERLLAAAEVEGDRRMAAGALNDLCVLEPDNQDFQQRLRKYRGEEAPVIPKHEDVGLVEEMEELELLGEEVAEEEEAAEEPGETTLIERTIEAPAAHGARPSGEIVAPKAPELTREQLEQIGEAHTEVDVYLKYGLRESAVEALEKILSINPADEKALDAVVGLSLGIGKREEALRHIVSLGLLRLSQGKVDLASRSLEEGRRIRKDDPALGMLEERIRSAGVPSAAPAAAPAPKAEAGPARGIEVELGHGPAEGTAEPILMEEEGEAGGDLEEADFYYRQGLLADALPIYQSYLASHPDDAQVIERVEEIGRKLRAPGVAPSPKAAVPEPVVHLVPEEEIAIGEEEPEAAAEEVLEEVGGYEEALAAAEAEAEAEVKEAEFIELEAEEPEAAFEEAPAATAAAPEPTKAAVPAVPGEAGGHGEIELAETESPSFELASPWEAAAPATPVAPAEVPVARAEAVVEEMPVSPEEALAEEALPEPEVVAAQAPSPPAPPPVAAAAAPAISAAGGEEFFDLAAELDEEISELDEAKGANLDATPVEDLASVFREFQEGVQAAIGEEDIDTHYNLGIAYKEMGLFTEAIEEFKVSMKSPDHSWDSAVMMGICHRERSDFDSAIDSFTKALLISDRSDDEYIGLRYELAQVYEKAGKTAEAVNLYREIQSRSKGFADVAQRIARLSPAEEGAEGLGIELEISVPEVPKRPEHVEEPVIAAPPTGSAKSEPVKEEAAKSKKNRVSYL